MLKDFFFFHYQFNFHMMRYLISSRCSSHPKIHQPYDWFALVYYVAKMIQNYVCFKKKNSHIVSSIDYNLDLGICIGCLKILYDIADIYRKRLVTKTTVSKSLYGDLTGNIIFTKKFFEELDSTALLDHLSVNIFSECS